MVTIQNITTKVFWGTKYLTEIIFYGSQQMHITTVNNINKK